MNGNKILGVVLIVASIICLLITIVFLIIVTQNVRTLEEMEVLDPYGLNPLITEEEKEDLRREIDRQWMMTGVCGLLFFVLLIIGIGLYSRKNMVNSVHSKPSIPEDVSNISGPIKDDKHIEWVDNGIFFAKSENYNEAINCFDKALKINPSYARAWNNKGIVLAKLGKYNEAITYYDRALDINPSNELALKKKKIAIEILIKPIEQTEPTITLQDEQTIHPLPIIPPLPPPPEIIPKPPTDEIVKKSQQETSSEEMLKLLEERLIKGEISEDTYKELKKKYE